MSQVVIDVPEFMDRVQDDKELFLELLDIYIEDFHKKRILLQQALENNNFEEIKSIAHSLKGSSGNISAKMLRESFLRLEEMVKNQDLKDFKKFLSDLDQQFQDVIRRTAELKVELK